MTSDLMGPLTVTVTLDEPLLTDLTHPVHLDGPLSWCAQLEAMQHGAEFPTMRDGRAPVDFNLGLDTWTAPAPADLPSASRTADGEAWGWTTSGEYPTPLGHVAVMQRRVPPAPALRAYTTEQRQHYAAGPHRARSITRTGAWIAPITWHVHGDEHRIRELLDRLTHIGAGTRHGYGRVSTVHVEPSSEPDGWRRRSWPDAHGTTHGGIRAPYHHHTRRTLMRPAPHT